MKMKAATGLLLIAFLTSPLTGDVLGAMPDTQEKTAGERSVNIAMCQIFCLDGDREGNFVRIENALVKAKAGNADIACFPETALLGWVNPDAHKRALTIPGKDSERLCQLAKKHQLYICVGLAEKSEKCEKSEEHLFDSALLIDKCGEVLLKHRKINTLDHLMQPPYAKGNRVQAVDTEFGRIGVLICADTFDEKVLARMKEQKPEILLVPYGWAAPEDRWPGHGKALEATVKNASKVVGCPLVGTDLVGVISQGPWKKMIYGGHSIAVDQHSKVLALCCDRDMDVEIVRVPVKKR